MLISDIEEMPPVVQEALIELLAGLEAARSPSAAVRLISGTTVSLLDQVAAGTFSERLFSVEHHPPHGRRRFSRGRACLRIL